MDARSHNGYVSIPHLEALEQRLLLSALGLNVSAVTTSTVSLGWNAATANQIRVYVSPEPDADKMVLLATLSGSATAFQATSLAANTHMFFTIEADPAGGGATQSQMINAKTKGGYNMPLSWLDTPVREVYSYGPNILQVVLANHDAWRNSQANNMGSTYQNGTWKVSRADGTPIAVTSVYRNTTPVGNPEYAIGYKEAYSDTIVDVDHHIFLVLGENIGYEDVLTISGPLGVSFILPFSDKYTETTAIQLNQVGYNPRATERWAYVSGWMGNGGGLSLSAFPTTANMLAEPTNPLSHRTVAAANLPVSMRASFDADSRTAVNQIDLSTMPAAEGVRYRIQLPGVGVSYVTAISEEAAFKAYYVLMRGLYHNRWGQELTSEYTDWSRPAAHMSFYVPNPGQTDWLALYPESTPQTNPRTSNGGYYDAGDFDQRPMHTIVPQLLLQQFDTNPSYFQPGQLTIPETIPGFALPDQLDEALWGVNGWVTLQESDGAVRAGVESWRHPWGYYFASDEPNAFWAYSRNAQVTARAAGLFAQASRLLRDLDSNTTGLDDEKAADLQTRAISAYNWAKNNGGAAEMMLYGASELFRLTGNTSYRTDFDNYWNATGFGRVAGNQLRQSDYADNGSYRAAMGFVTSYVVTPGATTSIVNSILAEFTNRANNVVDNIEIKYAHRNPRSATVPTWGEATGSARNLDPILARLQIGTTGLTSGQIQSYFNAMSLTADYTLGANPMGMCWVTGLGTRSPKDPLHLDAQAHKYHDLDNGIERPVQPGIVVYGPVEVIGSAYDGYRSSNEVFYPLIDSNYPIMRRYADSRGVVTTTEFTVWETSAPVAAMFGALVGPNMSVPSSWLPGQPNHINTLPGGMTATNARPIAIAGPDQSVLFPLSWVNLSGAVADDGFGGSTLTSAWTKVSGPGTVTFGSASSANTTARFSKAGTYVLRLTANDGTLSAQDDIVVTVIPSASVLDNGGFETGTTTGWTGINGTDRKIIANSGLGGTGNYLLHVTAADNLYPAFRTSGNGTQQTNTDYMLTFRFKWNVATTKVVTVNVKSSSGTLATMNVPTNTQEWQTLKLEFNSGANPFYVEFVHGGGGGSARNYYLDDVIVGKIDNAPNQVPVANAGPEQWVWDSDRNGSHSVTLNGTGSFDLDGTISSYVWKNGANQIATGANPSVTLNNGIYNLTLTVTDNNAAQSTSTVKVTVSRNTPPVANAGPDQKVYSSGGGSVNVSLNGSGSSSNGSIASYVWKNGDTQIGTGATPSVSLPVGLHNISLTITDDQGHTATDTVQIRVMANQAPVANAGQDLKVLLPNAAFLSGTAIDDGWPNGTRNITWSKVSGPGTVQFANANAAKTFATFDKSGTYVLRLTVSDGTLQSTDDVTVIAMPPAREWTNEANTVALYNFNGNFNDSSGNGRHLTAYGNAQLSSKVDWMSNPDGQSLKLTTRGDYVAVNIPDSVIMPGSSATALTIEARFLAEEWKGWGFDSYQIIGLRQSDDTRLAVFEGKWNSPANPLVHAANTTLVSASAWQSSVTNDEWHYLRITFTTGAVVSVYVDGVQLGSATIAQNYGRTNDWVLTLGNFKGYIDDVRISKAVRNGNQAPGVNAGPDLTAGVNVAKSIDATVSDDGIGTVTQTWTKVSGPGTVTFGNANAVDTTATFSAAGTYVLRLTASDGTYSAFDEMTVVVSSGTNQAPQVNAGNDQAITLPSVANLSGTASDDGLPSGTLTTTWSKQSGPGTVVFGNANALSTTASFSTAGTYVLRLTASDGALQSNDDVTITVNAQTGGGLLYSTSFDTDVSADWTMSNASINTGSGWMIVNSGWGATGTAYLAGSQAINRTDVKVTGSFGVMGGNPNMLAEIAARTSGVGTDGIRLVVTGSWDNASIYLYDGTTVLASVTSGSQIRSQLTPLAFELDISGSSVTARIIQTAGSGGGQSWVDKTHTLNGTITTTTGAGNVRFKGVSYTDQPRLYDIQVETQNTAPQVNAGNNQTITLPNSANLNGSATDDGLPNPPGTLTYTWSKVSGPGTVTFGNANAAITTAGFSTHGTYVLRLTASDSVLSGSGDVTITVNPANQAPTVNAGNNQTITLPDAANLSGTAGDDGLPNPPATLTTTWSKQSGPGTVTFGNANALSTTATFSTAGTYVLRLTASDSQLQTTSDVTITVNAPSQGGGGVLYETSFDTDVSADWTQSNTSINTGNGHMIVASGWGVTGHASLTGTKAINKHDVKVTGNFGVMGGNGNMLAEVAARTTGSGTDGIRLVVMGAWDNASIYLYDGANVLASVTSGSQIRSQFAPLDFELDVKGSTVTAKIIQTAGSGGGQSWVDKTHTLNGAIATTTNSGNVRFRGISYNEQPRLNDIKVESQVLYETSFDTDVSAHWAMGNASISTNDGWMIVNSGWGTTGYGHLTGSSAINAADVKVTGQFGVMGGNSNMMAEIAARTSGTGADGIRLVVMGAWNNAVIYLYDGTNVLASVTSNSQIRSQFAPLNFELVVSGTSVTAKIIQNAGSSGGDSWNDVTINLNGTAATTTAGNVRFRGTSYTIQPRLYDIKVDAV